MSQELATNIELACEHCDSPITETPIYSGDLLFCCHGCKSVYQILSQNGLKEFYNLLENSAEKKDLLSLKDQKKKDYSYLDDSEFLSKYASTNPYGRKEMTFYLEGVTCLACMWLIEKSPKICPDIHSAKLNFSKSLVVVTLREDGTFEKAAKTLETLGYAPHPIEYDSEAQKLEDAETRSELIKIGVAGACLGNIMIYSVGIYSGATGSFFKLFNLINFVLCLPVILYSAVPFYKEAYRSVKNKSFSIDLPITFAIIFSAVIGIINLDSGRENYFDSIAALVFLLSSARFILKRMYKKALSTNLITNFFSDKSIEREKGNQTEKVHPSFLMVGDKIILKEGEMLPVDGTLKSERGVLDTSFITGESFPRRINKEGTMLAGYVNKGSSLSIEVSKDIHQSALGILLKKLEQNDYQESEFVQLAQRFSKYLYLFVLGISVALIASLYQTPEVLIDRLLALVIVTCPCALGLTSPLALATAHKIATNFGIVIKDNDIFDKLSKVKSVYFDKTGTLTDGEFKLTGFSISNEQYSSLTVKRIIRSLEERSNHPIAAFFLKEFSEEFESYRVEKFNEDFGRGVHGKINGKTYFFGKKQSTKESGYNLTLTANEEEIATITLEDQTKGEAKDLIRSLSNRGLNIHLISGDRSTNVKNLASELEIEQKNCMSNLLPMDKEQIIKNAEFPLMIGDGVNDTLALKSSFVSMAISGGIGVCLKASDSYIPGGKISAIGSLFTITDEIQKVIKRNLTFSLIYNLSVIYLAVFGQITPLLAAIIMPLSSLSVLISTLYKTKKLRRMIQGEVV